MLSERDLDHCSASLAGAQNHRAGDRLSRRSVDGSIGEPIIHWLSLQTLHLIQVGARHVVLQGGVLSLPVAARVALDPRAPPKSARPDAGGDHPEQARIGSGEGGDKGGRDGRPPIPPLRGRSPINWERFLGGERVGAS